MRNTITLFMTDRSSTLEPGVFLVGIRAPGTMRREAINWLNESDYLPGS
jgi:hypothetical protein